MDLSTPLSNLPRVTPKYVGILAKLKLATARDLLFYFPFRYDDFRNTTPLGIEFIDKIVTVEGKIIRAKSTRSWKKRISISEIIVEDKNKSKLKSIWFNQPYILDSLREGTQIRLSGKLTMDKKQFAMINPAWEKSSRDKTNTGRLVPIYPETKGITSKWIRWQIKEVWPAIRDIPDPLPNYIREKYNLYDLATAIKQLHFPDSQEKVIRAQKRMAFQEMLLLQLRALQARQVWAGRKAPGISFNESSVKNFVKKLPFKLTNAQRKASFEILKDLEKERPMNRLLNGDVGSGKTVVAAIACLGVLQENCQATIMAPTEVLARQHFESFCELFRNYDFNIALLTNSYKLVSNKEKSVSRSNLLKAISENKIQLAIGTHALIQEDVKFKKLALVIIDEQHRFGVAQRAALQSETMSISDGDIKTIPHLLTMTATPIPRTMAIAFFGSLDLSVLDEMPKNRKRIITKVIKPKERLKVYEFIKSEIQKGQQVFIIFPLVTESEKLAEIKAATEEYKKLQKIFPDFKLGLLHGRLKARDKESVMADFKNKKTDILVSTSVVEVGIDIPDATVLIIENADRFGLTQLHQFRGRVGRGENQSYCFLFSTEKQNPAGVGTNVPTSVPTRLKILERESDGFKISEEDLRLRGPGQFFGHLQSGLPDVAMESLNNLKLIKFAREEAAAILKTDPQLKKHSFLQNAIQKFSSNVHME